MSEDPSARAELSALSCEERRIIEAMRAEQGAEAKGQAVQMELFQPSETT
jgi:hypothetical protein